MTKKKPANPTPAARVQKSSDPNLSKFFQALGTTEVPSDVHDVERVVHGLFKLWKTRPETLANVPLRKKGIKFAISMLVRSNNPKGLMIVEETIDALGALAPNNIKALGGFSETIDVLDGALPEKDFDQESEDDDADGVAALA